MYARPNRTQHVGRERESPAVASPSVPPTATRYVRTPATCVSVGCAVRSCVRSGERRYRPWPIRSGSHFDRPQSVRTDASNPFAGGFGFPTRVVAGPIWGTGNGGRHPRVGRSLAGGYRRCFGLISSLTVREWRPFRRRRASTLRPAFDFIRARKPWSFSLLRLLGFLNVGCMIFSLVHRGPRPAHLTESLGK
jgi:hypothetical protein